MKQFLRVIIFGNFLFSVCSLAATTHEQKTDLTQELVISNGELSVVAPKGWSFLNNQADTPIYNFDHHKSRGEILLTPVKDLQHSEVYVGLHDAVGGAYSVEKKFKDHTDEMAKMVTETWGTLKWDLVEWVAKTPRGYYRNWYAVTHLKNKDYFFLAGSPALQDSEFQPIILKIMNSVKKVDSK